MASRDRIVELPLNQRLRESRRQVTSMSLPLAIHHRLDRLATLADDVEATRAEIVGMLIAESSLEADKLETAMLRYRKLKVGDVLPVEEQLEQVTHEEGANNVVSIRRRGPGRPSRP
ncbi:MAG TPA: hypothetical protein VFN85_00330 [Solirubrobacterales bacterium]|nr:hypothetical protein [Solirubrobacterales bacterium]